MEKDTCPRVGMSGTGKGRLTADISGPPTSLDRAADHSRSRPLGNVSSTGESDELGCGASDSSSAERASRNNTPFFCCVCFCFSHRRRILVDVATSLRRVRALSFRSDARNGGMRLAFNTFSTQNVGNNSSCWYHRCKVKNTHPHTLSLRRHHPPAAPRSSLAEPSRATDTHC